MNNYHKMKNWIPLFIFTFMMATSFGAKLPDLTETTDPGSGSIMWVVDPNLSDPKDRKITIPNLRTEMGLSTLSGAETVWALNVIDSTEIDTSAEIAAIVTDETGTGGLVLSNAPALRAPSVITSIAPSISDGASLGTVSLPFSDIFLATGGVIDLGSDVTITHSANLVTIAGGNFVANGPNITLDASGFNGNLTTTDDTFQEIAQKLDDLVAGGSLVFVEGVEVGNPNLLGSTNISFSVSGTNVTIYLTNTVFDTVSGASPTINDDSGDGFSIFSLWKDTTPSPDAVYICLDATVGAAVWVSVAGGSLDGADLNDNSVQLDKLSNATAFSFVGATASGPFEQIEFNTSDFYMSGTELRVSVSGDVPGITGSGSTTNNDDFVTLYTYTFPETNLTAQLNAMVMGAGPTNIYGFDVSAVVKNVAGTAAIVGTNNNYIIPAAGTNITAYWDVTSNTARLRARGTASENINWVGTNILINVVTNGLASGGGGGSSYLIEQNFEGTGYDNSESWVEAGTGTIDEDSTTSPLLDSQSLRTSATTQTARATTPDFAAQDDMWVYFQFRVNGSLPAGAITVLTIRNNADGECLRVRLLASGALSVRAGGGTDSPTTDTLSSDTVYHVRAHYIKGSGANAVGQVEFSTTSTFLGSGNKWKESTNGTATTDAVKFGLGQFLSSGTFNFDFDRVLADDAEINTP